ncbi:MAG: zinc ribbon domain-containing protein [Lysobacteraceae bacterium]
MPIYAYVCDACGDDFDRLQKLSDPDPVDCTACGKPALRRKLSAPAFRLAGSGWYETDFKKDGDKKRNLVDSGEAKPSTEAAPAAAAPTGGDTKPAAPAPAPAAPADG